MAQVGSQHLQQRGRPARDADAGGVVDVADIDVVHPGGTRRSSCTRNCVRQAREVNDDDLFPGLGAHIAVASPAPSVAVVSLQDLDIPPGRALARYLADQGRVVRVRDVNHRDARLQAQQGVFALGVEIDKAPDVVRFLGSAGQAGQRDVRQEVDPAAPETSRHAAAADGAAAACAHGRVTGAVRGQGLALLAAQAFRIRHHVESPVAQCAPEFDRNADQGGLILLRRLSREMIEAVETAPHIENAAGEIEKILGDACLIGARGHQHAVALARQGQRVPDGSAGPDRQYAVARIPALLGHMAGNLMLAMSECQTRAKQQHCKGACEHPLLTGDREQPHRGGHYARFVSRHCPSKLA